MVIVLGTITVDSEHEADRLLAALAARARRSRADQGNIEYAFARSVEHPNEFRLTEVWESAAHLAAHLALPDAEFQQVLATARIVRADVKAYDGANARVLMAR